MIKRNLRLFKTHTNAELAKLWKLTAERVRQIRRDSVYASYKTKDIFLQKKYKTILNYLNKNKKKPFSITEFLKISGIHFFKNQKVNLAFIKKIAKKEKISLIFPERKTKIHGCEKYNRGLCKCKICKLANSIKYRFKYHGIKVLPSVATTLAHKYISLYKKDKSHHKKIFYRKLEKELRTKGLI